MCEHWQESVKFNREALEKEISILKSIDHPNCMRLYGVYGEVSLDF